MADALILIGTFIVSTFTLQLILPKQPGSVWLYCIIWGGGVTTIVAGLLCR